QRGTGDGNPPAPHRQPHDGGAGDHTPPGREPALPELQDRDRVTREQGQVLDHIAEACPHDHGQRGGPRPAGVVSARLLQGDVALPPGASVETVGRGARLSGRPASGHHSAGPPRHELRDRHQHQQSQAGIEARSAEDERAELEGRHGWIVPATRAPQRSQNTPGGILLAMATREITAETIEDTITGNDIVLLDFWAEWCGPCRMFGPIFEKAAETHTDIVFGKIDTEAQQELAAAFDIRSIPTLMAFRENVLVYAQPGALMAPQLEQLIAAVRGLDMEDVHAKVAEQRKEQESAGAAGA